MKRLLPVLLCATLLLGLVSAPAMAKTNMFGWEVPEETLTITAFYNSDQFTVGEEQKRGMEAMKAYLLKEFNIDYNIITTDGTADEQLNLMLASNTYPDVIIGASTINRQKFVDQGRAADLTEYLENSPNLLKRLGALKGLYADANGKYFYLPRSFYNLMDLPDYTAHVRYDEYQELGAPEIKTPEDWYNFIKQVQEKHPVTANNEQRYTLTMYNQGLPELLSGYWGLQRGFKVNDDNTLTYWTHTDEGKAMAKFFNTWWRTGTMDPDSLTNAWNDARTKVSQKRVIGLIGGWWIGYNAGHEIWSLTDKDWNENIRYIQVGFKAEGAKEAYLTLKNNAGGSWTIITDKCKDPAGVMKWIDFTQTDVGIALTNWGMPNEVESFKNPGTYAAIWHLNEDGSWNFDEKAKADLIAENWDYNEEGVYGANSGVYQMVNYQGRFDDGIHCLWPNQMWYSENKWKGIMFENMKGTIFDGTPLLFESLVMDEEVTLAKTAITDAWKQYYPLVVMADSDEAFEAAWAELGAAVENAGLESYIKYRTENYQHNLAMMAK